MLPCARARSSSYGTQVKDGVISSAALVRHSPFDITANTWDLRFGGFFAAQHGVDSMPQITARDSYVAAGPRCV